MYSISHPEFHCTEDFSLIMQTLQRLQHNTSLPHFKRMAPPWFHSFIHVPQIPGMPRTINTWWRVEDTVVNETFSASGVHHPLGFLIPQAFLSICHMPYHVLSVGTQQRSRQKIKSFLNSVILGIDMSYEESTAEEVIAGAIFSRLITEAMFEQGPPWLKQWINQFSCGKICWEVVAVVQSLSHVWLFVIPQSTAHQATLSFTISWSLCKLMSIESVMPSNHLILCGPLPLLSSIFPRIRVFTNELALHIRWPKYWSFSFSISPSNEYAGLISLKIDWFDLAAQGILKSLSQHQCSKASILQHSTFFMVKFICTWLLEKNHGFDNTDLCWQSDAGQREHKT